MDMSMDVRNELDFQFLDLRDLDDSDKNQIISILKSNTALDAIKLPWDTVENTHDLTSTVTEISEIQTHWYHNALIPENQIYHNAIPPAHPYPQQVITTMCNDWQTPMYSVPADGHVPPFITGMAYPQPGYNLGGEIHDVSYGRENGRRSNRGRGIRRDNFNRGMNPANDMQSGYMGEQGQFHPQMSVVCIIPEYAVSPQQQVAGQFFFPPPMYSSPTIHPQPNAHPHAHTTYPTHHHPGNMRYIRQPVLPQPTQDCVKAPTPKNHEKRAQNAYTAAKPPFHQTNEEDNNSSQTNIVTTVIVNNSKLEPCVDNADKNTANIKNMNTNGKVPPVNVKIEHNIVSTVNENCNGAEKNDVPCVNINSSIEVKQNGETDKDFKNETVSSIKTTVVKTLSKPTSKAGETELQTEESAIEKDAGDEIVPKTPTSTMLIAATATATPSPCPMPTVSWANILKKGNTEAQSTPLQHKPTAYINPLPPNSNVETTAPLKAPLQAAQKDQHTENAAPDTENTSSNVQTAVSDCKMPQGGVPRNSYDDPNMYRMGEFLLNYQMDKQTVSLLPRGLTNRSNYCYINSILQALLACPPFYNLLVALPHSKQPSKNSSTPLIDNMVKFVHEFTPLSDAARVARKDRAQKRGDDAVVDIQSGVAFEPSYVYTMLKNTSAAGGFSVEGRQEDAEEFLSCLLNGINDEMLELMKLVSSDQNTVTNEEPNVNYNHGEEEWKQVIGPKHKGSITRCTEFGRTPLSDIFRGQLRSRVSRAGEQSTDNVQPFFTLQLDIEEAESVDRALEILVRKDELEGMTCSKTKQKIEASKQVTLEELPVILILHLKWFDYKLNSCSKIVKKVQFPVDLTLGSKFLSPNAVAKQKHNTKQKQYKLFAVTYHDGKEATKGHYVTDAFHVGYGSWVRYDDSSVKSIAKSNVLNPAAPRVPYLLYYRRCDIIGSNQSNSGKQR